MKSGLEVFDFKEEDEVAEYSAVARGSAVVKKESGAITCVEVREDLTPKEDNSQPDAAFQSESMTHEKDCCSKMNKNESKSSFTEQECRDSNREATSPGKALSNCALAASPSHTMQSESVVNVKSEADAIMKGSSPSTPGSDIAENGAILNGHLSDNQFSTSDTDIINITVDYVVYRDNYWTGCVVTFSWDGIKISGMPAYGDHGTFSFERGIDDIIHIECQHLEKFGAVTVKLHLISKGAEQATNAYANNSELVEKIEQLEFAVVEPNWSGKFEEVASLNVKYSALSATVQDADVSLSMDERSELLQQRPFFPIFDETVEDVVYPKGDSDAVSISKRDFDLLQPETFINDTIIDFYIKYVKNQISPEEKHRFHFFNSFFFRKLADLDKDPSSASDGRAAFLRVHKWTRKVDMFGKDYVFIPVNFNLHWSLLVICHPGEVASFKDEDLVKSLRVPCVLHMDSIKGTHAGLKNLVQSYLWEEWKSRQKDTSEDLSSKFFNLRFVPLELPQQENSFDCGLFLLHYLELFLADAPMNFSPFKINEFSKFLNVDWFPPVEASLKRTLIQRLISELLENHPQELSSGDCSDEPESSLPENNGKETRVQFVPEGCTRTVACHGNLSTSDASQGIEITLLESSSVRNSDCVNDPGLVLRELFEPGVVAGSLLTHCSSIDQPSYYRINGAMSQQIEPDHAESGEPFVYFPSGDVIFQQIAGITTPQAGSLPYALSGLGTDPSWNPGISMQVENDSSSPETSICASDDSDVGIIENCPVVKDLDTCHKEKIDQQRSQSMENIECWTEKLAASSSEMLETSAIGGTEDPDKMCNANENGNLSSCHENLRLHKDTDMIENGLDPDSERTETMCDMQTMGEDVMAESDKKETIEDNVIAESEEQQAAKRHRVTPLEEGEVDVAGSPSKDLHL